MGVVRLFFLSILIQNVQFVDILPELHDKKHMRNCLFSMLYFEQQTGNCAVFVDMPFALFSVADSLWPYTYHFISSFLLQLVNCFFKNCNGKKVCEHDQNIYYFELVPLMVIMTAAKYRG